MSALTALDLFAGTGWGVACQRLGIEEYGVEIMPEAVATREANGMHTIYNDVWDGLRTPELVPAYKLLIASPPCQTFSLAGKGSGRQALDDVLGLLAAGAHTLPGDGLRKAAEAAGLDDRTALVLSPLAYVFRDEPTYVAFEQVPAVLPVWEACAEIMREWGYSVATGVLNAEQYGVPQTRKRAILVARRDGEVQLPTPTHSRYYSNEPTRLDEGVLPWVSMAEALGWGGSSVRKALDAKIGGPNWIDKPNQTVDARTTYAQRFDVQDVATLQTYPSGGWGFTNRPAVTVGNAVGRGLIGGSGAKAAVVRALEDGSFIPSVHVTDGSYAESTRITVAEAGVLQTYARPFIWTGTKTKQFLQIGNAVPPLLAEAILSALIK